MTFLERIHDGVCEHDAACHDRVTGRIATFDENFVEDTKVVLNETLSLSEVGNDVGVANLLEGVRQVVAVPAPKGLAPGEM